jgi:hypothetical protein
MYRAAIRRSLTATGSRIRLVEVVSEPSIGFKIKAARGVQPEEYFEYFED